MVGFPLFQLIEHQVHGVFELLIVLPDLHAVDHLDEGGKVLFLHRGFVVDVADQRAVQKRLCLDPEIIPGLALALGVGDQRCHQLQDVLFAMDIAEGVIVHRLLEVDGIEHFYLVSIGCKQFSNFIYHCTFWISNNIARMHLHKIRFHKKSGLTGTGTTYHNDILIPCVFRILRS